MAESVKITLSLDDLSRENIPFPRRELVLDEENKSIVVGRASKVETKGLVSSPNNAWFLSPVMSRQHAEIVANLKDKKVIVKDLGSLHGTFVNGETEKLKKDEARELQDGDQLQLGIRIFRGNDAFPPTTLGVNIEYREKKTDSPTTTFQVPDCSDVEEDYSSDSNSDVRELTDLEPRTPTLPIAKVGSTPLHAIDLTQLSVSNVRHCQIIDLSSPPHSPLSVDGNDDSNSVVEVNIPALENVDSSLLGKSSSSDQSSRMASPDLSTASPDASMTSPEIGASNTLSYHLANPAEICHENDDNSDYESSLHPSTDDDEMMEHDGFLREENETNSEGESDMDSADDLSNLSSVEYEDDLENEENLHSDVDSFLCSENEEDEDSEDLEEDAEFDTYSSEDEASDSGFGFSAETFRGAFWEDIPPKFIGKVTAKDTKSALNEPPEGADAVERLSQGKFVNQPLPAYSSSADFIVAPSESLSHGVKTTGAVAINTLLNTEKAARKETATAEVEVSFPSPAIFAAREPSPSDAAMPKSRYSIQADDSRNVAQILGEMTGKGEFFAAREHNKILAKTQRSGEPRSSVYSLCNGVSPGRGPFSLDAASTMGQFLKRNMEQIPEPEPLQLPDVNWTEPAVEPTPAQEVVPTGESGEKGPESSQSSSENTSTSLDDQSLRRTHLGISDIVEGCQLAPSQVKHVGQAVQGVRGKRKADDMSTSTAEEEQWSQPAVPEKTNPQTEEVTVANHSQASPITDGPSFKALGPSTIVSQETEGRPAKRLRHIAERFGYAALGGVTAGAMIFGTLVYTAPTFV